MADQIVSAERAATLYAEALERKACPAWIVFADQPRHPGKIVARLNAEEPTESVLIANTLAELRVQLPRGLVLSSRHPADPPDVLEMWSSP